MFKKVTALSILFILLVNMAGYFPVFKWEQMQIRREIKQQIKNSIPGTELCSITFAKKCLAEIDWERQGKEFRYNGQMYDVIRTENKADSVHYYCIKDTQETRLFAQLDEFVKKQMDTTTSSTHNPVRNLLKVFLSLVYLPSNSNDSFQENSWTKNECSHSFCYSELYLDKVSPPPKFI